MLGRNVLGRYPLGTTGSKQNIIIDFVYFEHVFEQVQPQQQHFVNVSSMSFELSFTGLIPTQAQWTEVNDLAIEHDFTTFVPTQTQNAIIDSFTIKNEFQTVNIFVDEMDFRLEFENVYPSQIHDIATIDDLIVANEFEQCVAIQVHVIPHVSSMTFANYFDELNSTQVHILQPQNMEFGLSFNKIFPATILGGYMFVTVNDNGTEYNLSFEGIESE